MVAVGDIVDQAAEIGRQFQRGLEQLVDWLDDHGLQVGDAEDGVDGLADLWDAVGPGLTSYLGTVFSGTTAFLAGTFVGIFLLYFILAPRDRRSDHRRRDQGAAAALRRPDPRQRSVAIALGIHRRIGEQRVRSAIPATDRETAGRDSRPDQWP